MIDPDMRTLDPVNGTYLKIFVPPGYEIERKYIISVIFDDVLGLPYQIIEHERHCVSLSVDESQSVVMPDVFFRIPDSMWLKASSVPILPLANWDTGELGINGLCVSQEIPVLYGREDERPCNHKSTVLHIPIDILGSCFFMLSRYEEVVSSVRDIHDRFPAGASIAYKAGFLDRPIVDEYIEILWTAMKRVWPGLKRKSLQPRIRISCDVDSPYLRNEKSPGMTLKNMMGDLLKRGSAVQALRRGRNTVYSLWGDYRFDPMNTFDWIMDVNEKAGNRVAFYFLAGSTASKMDGSYSILEPRIRALMRRIHARGHEIGLHGSYGTYLDESQHMKEADRLREVMAEEGIDQDEIGNRQHYLRWRTPETARNLEKAGIKYDTTLGYADRPGFRCGTCFPYTMYDLCGREPLRLRQVPLVLMEGTVIKDSYLGMGYTARALDLMLNLKKRALRFGGEFTLLWHNSCLESDVAKRMYLELVSAGEQNFDPCIHEKRRKRYRLAHLTSAHPRDDIRIFGKQCRSLARHGHDVTLVVADGLGGDSRDGVTIVDVGRLPGRLNRMFRTTGRVFDKAAALDADLYHLHDPELLPIGLRLKRLGKRVVFDSHEDVPMQMYSRPYLGPVSKRVLSFVFSRFERYACRRLDGIVAATPFIRDKFLGIHPRSLDVNNYPFVGELDAAVPWAEKREEVCYVGGISSARGIREVVRACGRLETNARLNLAGAFSEPAVEAEVKGWPGWSRVIRHGVVDRAGVRDLLGRSLAGLVTFLPLPNHVDAQPNKMFEYMSAGVPVIASNFPLWRVIIEGNECGLCVDPLDPEAIAGAIDRLVRNPDLARRMGENGRAVVLGKYNWSIEEKKLLDLYAEVLGERGGKP